MYGSERHAMCEEIGDDIILKKDPKTGEVIGFEKLNYSLQNPNKKLPIDLIVQ